MINPYNSLNKRLIVVEQTLQTVVFRLNDFLSRMDEVANGQNESVT